MRCGYKHFGNESRVVRPLKIEGKGNIWIGEDALIQYKSWLAAVPLTGENATLIIDDGCRIGNFNHIYATRRIYIGKNVLTADKVYISDNQHDYQDINTPILKQPIIQLNDVYIGDGTWIGENVCILGVTIGRNCVIGANAVVTKDIPDYCVVVGSPGRIIKRYNVMSNQWENSLSK